MTDLELLALALAVFSSILGLGSLYLILRHSH
jgi:hypothetical protein